jgi:glycyl-tRNA synthetase
MIDNKDSNKRYRADQLLEDRIAKWTRKVKPAKAEELQIEMDNALKAEDLPRLRELIIEQNIKCPVSGTANWTDVRQFNLMFSTQVGAYCR